MLHKKKLLVIFSTHQTLHWFSVGLLAPILALMQMAKGLDLFQIGLAVAVFSGTVIIFELPTGGLADAIDIDFSSLENRCGYTLCNCH